MIKWPWFWILLILGALFLTALGYLFTPAYPQRVGWEELMEHPIAKRE